MEDFQSAVEDIDEVTKKITVTVAKDRVKKEYDTSLKQVGKTARIDGFRPGKVPKHMVERMMGERIRFDIANKLINESLQSVIKEHELQTVGQPQIDLQEMPSEKELEFSATIELVPQPKIENYLDRTVEVKKVEVSDEDVEKQFQQIVESRAELNPIEDRTTTQEGDVVALSVSMRVDDDGEFSKPEPFVDELGGGRLSPQVEKELVGVEVKSEQDIEITADDSHPLEGVRGKKVAYKISVHGIYAKKLPELNDEFAKSLNMDVETVDALKEKLKSDLVAKAEGDTTSESQGALLELIASENDFKVPPSLIDDEIREMVLRMGFAGQDAKPESIDVEQFRPHFEETAIQRLKVAIVVDRIGAQEDVQVEEADTKSMIEKIAQQNGVTVEVATKALLDKSRIGGFFAEVRRTKIVDLLMSRTTVNFVTDAETKKEKSSGKKGGKAKKTSAAA